MAKINNLGKDKINTLVLKLAIPSMLAQFVNVLYGIVDRVYIGNIAQVGDTALAGVGVCSPVVTLVTSFAFLVGVGGAPLLAMRMGEKNEQGASAILANAFVMLLALGAMLTAVFLIFKKPLLLLFGASDATFEYADTYMTICIAGCIFVLVASGLNQFIICQGFATVAMVTVVVGALLNVVLDPIFIFTLNLGVAGAAIATVLSQAVSCAIAVVFLLSPRARIRIAFYGYSTRIIRRIISFGLSPFIILATDSVIMIVLNAVLQYYGGAKRGDMLITCATIVLSYFQIISMPLGGITGGTQPILSYNYGAKKISRIKKAEKSIVFLGLIFVIIMFAVSQFVPQYFVKIFTDSPEYIRLSVWGIRVFTLGIIPMAFQYAFVDALTALGIAKAAISLSLFRKISFLVCTVLLPRFFLPEYALFAEPVADCIAGVVSTTVFLLIFNPLLKKREAMPDGAALYD